MKYLRFLLILAISFVSHIMNAGEVLRSPDGRIEVKLEGNEGRVSYSVSLNGTTIIGPSGLGLKPDGDEQLEIIEVSRSSEDRVWESVWGTQKTRHDTYNEIRMKVGGTSAQTIIFRAYNEGVAFRYMLPENREFGEQAYAHEASAVSFVSEKPTAWFPLSSTLVSDAVDVNSWKTAEEGQGKVNKNTRYDFMPSVIRTPFTLKLSEKAYISLHEAAVIHSDDAGLRLTGNTLTYISNPKTAGGSLTPWRTITIADRPGGLIESSLIVNLNEPSEIEDTGWIRPGKTMWDWRNHGAHADDGFEYGLTTESYIRYIDFAAEHNIEYVLVDAEWYGPERDPESDPKKNLPQIDIPKICAYGNSKGVRIWLYVNNVGLTDYDLDETFRLYNQWGVAGIKHGFLSGASREHIEFSHRVVKKCAEYQIQYTVHEPYKPTGYRRTYPNILSHEYVNSMLDGPTRPSATPGRLINSLFVHALAGPVDRSCGMFDLDDFITREKCHRQLPSTVVSQAAQCLLFPSGLLTLPDHPDAYKRKADLFEFISHLPMNWDETRVLDAEIGQHITLARRSGDQWFAGALADEEGRKSCISLDFLEEGLVYDVTLYEDAPDAHYEFFGPENKGVARANNLEMKPHKTRRELYQVKKISAKKGDLVPIVIAPGGGHCMWIRPSKTQTGISGWPVLKTYDLDHIQKISMPVGGIGTGTVSLTGRGSLEDWEIMNRPAKGFNPTLENRGPVKQKGPFFAIYLEDEKGGKQTRLLEGPPDEAYYEGAWGATSNNHGLPRFSTASFQAAYPFGQVLLSDQSLPVEVVVGAFNPLIPGNVDDSSIPMVILNYKVKNTSDKEITMSIAGSIQNFIGFDGTRGQALGNINTYREDGDVKGIHYTSGGVDPRSEQWGSMSFVSLNDGETTYRTAWQKMMSRWDKKRLDFWDDFSEDGLLESRVNDDANAPMGSLAVKTSLQPGEEKNFRFLISWHFPNRPTWDRPGFWKYIPAQMGNYYTTRYTDSWDVIEQTLPRLEELEARTLAFVNALIESDIPTEIKESALFNLAHLRTQLAFRIKSGQLLGWEGLFDDRGSCFGSCTHVWNYEQTTAFLFGELAKTMREVEYGYATDDRGLMSFRVYLPLDSAQLWGNPAADGQMGCIMKFYRDWQLSGDDEFLDKYWPVVRKSLEFCWIPGGWDADRNGVMEGSQHNTMDVEYFGPNPQMGFWYLGALKASAEMATYLGDKKFARTCQDLYEQGSEWMDENLFNGEYYEQRIQPPMSADNVAECLLGGQLDNASLKASTNLSSPDFQLGKGVLVDQLIGQLFAHIAGLGYLGREENIKRTHESIMKYNYVENLSSHANFHRSYALGDESALLMAAYPGERPEKPFPYYSEVMTGFEYTAAIGMLYEGQTENGLKCIRNIRDRYDGKKRSPFNEAEAGHHYSRSMIAWAGILATTGFQYSAVNESMSFNPDNGKYFWSNGYQYGTVEIREKGEDKTVVLSVLNGDLSLKSFSLNGFGETKFKKGKVFRNGTETGFTVTKD